MHEDEDAEADADKACCGARSRADERIERYASIW